MPVLVTDYTWTQSSTSVNIRVPLKGVPSSYVHIFTCDDYIKAHYQPFLFEVFLLHKVSNDKSKCCIYDGAIQFEFYKVDDVEWSQLEKKLSKEEKLIFKKEVYERCQEEEKLKYEEKVTRDNELKRFSVRQAMEIDNHNHTLMDRKRDTERNKAMKQLENWRHSNTELKLLTSSSKSSIVETVYTADPSSVLDIKKSSFTKNDTVEPVKPKNQFIKSEYVERKKEEMNKRELPQVRGSSNLTVNFSARVFPTPSRESTTEEETTWLRKMAEARRATGFVSEDLRPEEQDPQWCKDKGDELFRDGNLLGAISAYSHAIKLSDKYTGLYANRAAAHFALGNFNKCVMDCSTALELMQPVCEGNRVSRARCIARRAAALARLGLLGKAIDEMKAASKLIPDNENIKKDIYNMERAWEQNPDSD